MTRRKGGKKEKKEDLEKRIVKIIDLLEEQYPEAKIALKFSNPLELLVAVILSAQCTDVQVNKVTKDLFKKYRTIEDYADVNPKELQEDIRTTGFFRNKAKSIKNSAKIIKDDFKAEVPDTMEELLTLPGVARKTANIVLYNAFDIQDGIAVDTHVKRLSQRMNLTKNKDPKKIERDLMKIVPKEIWGHFTYLLIDHGRSICTARKAKCEECPIAELCPKIGVERK